MVSEEKNPRSSLDKLLREKPEEMTANDFGNLADEIEAETRQVLSESDALIAELSTLSPKEQAWAEWFSELSVENKDIVEMCAKQGIAVTADNLEQILIKLKQETE